ncbi:UbiA family prenyltransferase [Aspergillus vadensis CBS 113365]|uniref:UbiA prenyltransferase n=1 Tax=Aspergillus vadensis (strain CBS 113365 / IMI 142717 / IBT 24658) TaxID=1448311 RepID=A0A319BJ50_ASPVC|nr:hypothetical protein BO88DRAFT_428598 [Aspergillus vadensis CBS 113365]PYH65783.1 hypothetical protein BO88DRAFT_428598 [Aspergillus vadensis CBS 113365]
MDYASRIPSISLRKWFTYQCHTIFLFIYSDFKTIVLPSTVFGVVNSLATTSYGLGDETSITLPLLFRRSFSALLWVSLVFIPFSINNQRTPSAIAEDAVNKPWRPMPQRRISPAQALVLMGFFIFLAQVHIQLRGGIGRRQSLILLALDLWYNTLSGADKNPIVRNAINALGYTCFLSGALEVSLERPLSLFQQSPHIHAEESHRLDQWLFIIACIVFSTVHLQDLYDQKGDFIRGRRTLPLVIGDTLARWIVAVPMLFWGVACPLFWHLTSEIFALSMSLACIVACRVLAMRTEEEDRTTFLFWNCWISIIYMMPLAAEWG